MSNVVVYVFLLDNLAGFGKALNDTVIKSTVNVPSNTTVLRQCDSSTSNQILNAVSRELDLQVVPLFRNGIRPSSVNEESQENLYNALLESSLPEVEGREAIYEKAIDSFDFDYNEENERSNNVDFKENINNVTVEVRNATERMELVEFPKKAPFLVALFETLSNVTAQTCAGTLIAPGWVLTGANCVSMLRNLYANNTNMTDEQPLHTVVAGAIDPLSDGSACNVTTVILNKEFPRNSSRNRKDVHMETGPYLAMMKIEPAFEGAVLPLVEDKIKKGDVMIYGWILSKKDSGLDTMNLVIMSAQILSSAECQAMYSFNNNDVICLFNNDKKNITQLSSGGPVLMLQDGEVKMLAVAQTDEHVLIAYPLYAHFTWIKSLINKEE